MKRTAVVALSAVLGVAFAPRVARADTVVTKDGPELHGKIVEETALAITIETEDRRELVPLAAVASVTRGENGEGDDLVLLQDGSTHRGKILEEAWGNHVTLLEGTDVKQFAWSQVASCTRPRAKQAVAVTPEVTVGKGGIKLEAGGKLDDAERTRQAWLERGGWLLGYDASGTLVFFAASKQGVTVDGLGGGVSFHGTYYFLQPPAPGGAVASWMGFRIGAGFESAGILASGSGKGESASLGVFLMNIPLSIGGQYGFGTFLGNGEWKGIMVGADYKPSYTYVGISGYPGLGAFSPVGLQATVDFVDFHSVREGLEKQVREAQWRITAYGLPPVNGNPALITVGVGAVWY